ncbi:hypothetical protein NCS57_01467200 [Fusarium keratoplasticum]|uniref:Uncharacterized protein n=1 Tax=Fusarium keratoplasticum TaxID=1328300 RepID=A0ACC0QAE4_9HYPO|nr:hypothetical protein NCS57_01467200 [Fusarium keratoplasticum]KAI8648560.1 hypothetical protein NCS57_01467200 [Fusarium keratoplasticum]
MADWDKNEQMAAWDKKYVSTNVKPNARNAAIIASACCAVGRADVVGRIFDDLTTDASPEDSQKLFMQMREAITIVFPYLGMPTLVPACYGMIGVVNRKGLSYAHEERLRQPIIDAVTVDTGFQLRSQIYRGVGNEEIFSQMEKLFTDLHFCSTVVGWGFLISKASEEVFGLEHSHLIVAATIMALGATRQTRSHIKATLGLGNSIDVVKAVAETVMDICDWAERNIESFDFDALSVEIQAGLLKK